MSQNNPEFEPIAQGILNLLGAWEPKLTAVADPSLFERRNHQNRTIKEILGHLIDSASNKTHRIIQLQKWQN